MKKIAYVTALVLFTLGAKAAENGLDELGDIKLVDESSSSTLYQHGNIKGTIVGCHDSALKEELACSKKPKDAILSKLPTSQQLEEVNLEDDSEREEIKEQLASILDELNYLKKAQQADRDTIKQLKAVIADLSSNEQVSKPVISKNVIQEKIQKITPKKSQSKVPTLIKQKIKEISRTEDAVVIEVQNNESLSTYAQAYYGDNRKYYKIFEANKDILPESMILIIGEKLTIPLK